MGQAHQFWIPDLFGYMVVFLRFAGVISLMPGLSESYVNPQVRLWLAFTLSLIATPLVSNLPPFPDQPGMFVGILISEYCIGLFLGMIMRIMLSALDVAGAMIGFQMNLSNAFAEGVASSQQVALPGVFLGVIAVVLMFVMDLHAIILRGLLNSYNIFPAGLSLDFTAFSGDVSQILLDILQQSFILAIQIASPVIIVTLLIFFGGGVINRLVPQIQIFFVLQPLQIFIGFFALFATLHVLMPHFMSAFTNSLITFFHITV